MVLTSLEKQKKNRVSSHSGKIFAKVWDDCHCKLIKILSEEKRQRQCKDDLFIS